MKPEMKQDSESEIQPTLWGAFMQGVREGPRVYFAPLVLLYKALRFVFRYMGRKVAERVQQRMPAKGAETRHEVSS